MIKEMIQITLHTPTALFAFICSAMLFVVGVAMLINSFRGE